MSNPSSAGSAFGGAFNARAYVGNDGDQKQVDDHIMAKRFFNALQNQTTVANAITSTNLFQGILGFGKPTPLKALRDDGVIIDQTP